MTEHFVKELIKGNIDTFYKAYDVSQDELVEILEDIAMELKTQGIHDVPSLKENEGEASENEC